MALKWSCSYSVYTASAGSIGYLVVAYGGKQDVSPGYEVSAFGVKLKDNSPDVPSGKRRAIALAGRLLNKALAELEDALVENNT